MTGTLALCGGGHFTAEQIELDRRLLAAGATSDVVVLPTADAFEHPQRLIDAATSHFAGIAARVQGLMVLTRTHANDPQMAEQLSAARLVYLVGDNPLHMRSALKDTLVYEELAGVLRRGGVIVASGGSASGLCDPMVDPRGGAYTLGLAMVTSLAVITESETWAPERMKRSLELANGFTVAELPTNSALVRTATGWEQIGPSRIHGPLP
jgi:cyanophycinase